MCVVYDCVSVLVYSLVGTHVEARGGLQYLSLSLYASETGSLIKPETNVSVRLADQ